MKRKRTSQVLEKASARLQGVKSINSTLDLGNGLSVVGFESSITETRTKLDEFHHYISLLAEKVVELDDAEKNLRDMSERMLSGVASRFGKNSAEYVQAGGVRKSEIKRSRRKTTTNSNPTP